MRTGIARALSKLGYCSRSAGSALVRAGRVSVNDQPCRDPEHPVWPARDRIAVDGASVSRAEFVHWMLNKPRGLVTTASDEQGRDTVFTCLEGRGLPHLAPVGRLDKASEGLLLFTNDTAWAARITDPRTHLDKTYHVQVDSPADERLLARLREGVRDGGERLSVKSARELRSGAKNSWLELILDEGRNRHIRRLLAALDVEVLRLVRVAIGPLQLGPLAKGDARPLTRSEVAALGATARVTQTSRSCP
jgi:23S rRNA pseudouridine2605 synthase